MCARSATTCHLQQRKGSAARGLMAASRWPPTLLRAAWPRNARWCSSALGVPRHSRPSPSARRRGGAGWMAPAKATRCACGQPLLADRWVCACRRALLWSHPRDARPRALCTCAHRTVRAAARQSSRQQRGLVQTLPRTTCCRRRRRRGRKTRGSTISRGSRRATVRRRCWPPMVTAWALR